MLQIRTLGSGSSGNCYHLVDGDHGLMIEAGLPLSEIQQGVGFSLHALAGVLISHEHGDHSLAVPRLLYNLIDCWATPGTIAALKLQRHRLMHPIQPGVPWLFDRGPWRARAFSVPHDAAEPVGFLIDSPSGARVCYISDAGYSPVRFAGVTHYMVECNHSEEIMRDRVMSGAIEPEFARRIMRNHLGLETVLKLLQANDLSKVQEIHLLHLSRANSNADEFTRAIQRATGRPVIIAPEKA